MTETEEFHRKAAEAIYLQGALVAYLRLDPDATTAKQVESDVKRRFDIARTLNAALRDQIIAGDDRVLRCAFCGEAYPEGTPTHKHEALTNHIRHSAEHPVGIENRALRAFCKDMRTCLTELRDEGDFGRVKEECTRLLGVLEEVL